LGDRIIIDAKDLIYGRLAAIVAKKALEGEQVVVVNIEQVIFSGDKIHNLEFFKRRRERTRVKYPRTPDRIFRRSVRGMIPYKTPRGIKAYRKVKVFIGTPAEYEGKTKTIDGVNYAKFRLPKFQRLGDICKEFGWNG
jgi:large subunit ribosomal protein L13